MRVGRRFVITIPADSYSLAADWADRSETILAAAGFRDIVLTSNQVRADRGSVRYALHLSVDPRRHRHTIDIAKRAVTYSVNSPTHLIFSSADEDVFKAEARSFLARLSDTPFDEHELPLALARQRANDKKLIVPFLLFCLLLGIVLAFILPV